MSEEAMIRTVCSNCGMVYDLPGSLIGQYGECAECGAAFQITDQTDYVNQMLAAQNMAAAAPEPEAAATPAYEPAAEVSPEPEAPPAFTPAPEQVPAESAYPPPPPVPQEGDVVMGQDEDSAPTNTVKLTRVSRAGMLPEVKDNPFKVGTINVSSQTVIGATHGSRRFTTSRKFSSSSRSTFTPPPKKKKHWWEFWK